MRRKVCVVITARASYSRIKTALTAISDHPKLELQLVVAASALLDQFGYTIQHIEEDGFEVAARVYMVVEGENPAVMAKTTGLGLMELATVFDNLKPDIVLTIADRYETLATAVAASYMNIPLAHVQGGEVTGSIDEKVRHAVTKLSNIHFVATKQAARRVINMGEARDTVFTTGCPSIDLLTNGLKNSHLGFDPIKKYDGVGESVDLSDGYIVVLQHPVTTEYELAREHVTETLHAVKALNIPALWFWPNVDAGSDGTSKGIRAYREIERPKNIHYFKNMKSKDFLELVFNSRCIVGNSSVAIRECSYLGVPAINIGTRQMGRERGMNVVDVQYNRNEISSAILQQVNNGRYQLDTLYGDGNAGKRIAKLLAKVPLTVEKRLTY